MNAVVSFRAMVPHVFAFLFRGSHSDPSGSGVIFGVIALAVIGIIVLSKVVFGGDTQTKADAQSLSLRSSGSASDRDAKDSYRERFHEKAPREASVVPEPKQKYANLVQESIKGWSDDPDSADAEFEATIAETIPLEAQEKAFYVKVRGTFFLQR